MYQLPDFRPVPDPVYRYSDELRNTEVPIVIDNGSYQCRVGWAIDDQPRMIFRNLVAKQRGKKDYEAQVGNDISNVEVVRWLLKTQFDKDVVTQYDVQEQVFDYIFTHLGINTQGSVDHPIVMTETLCSPNYSRHLMSELLFEGYHIPRVAYGVDSLFSFHYNADTDSSSNGLIVSCGYHVTHLIPVLNGRAQLKHSRRINVGGNHLISFMHRLLQLKYPAHFSAITLSRAEGLVHEHTRVASDYAESLAKWIDSEYYEENVHKIQLPFTPLPGSTVSAEAQKERRQQQIRRLQEMNAKRREEKLAADEEKLQQLLNVQELLEDEDEEAFSLAMDELGYSSAQELQDAINKLNNGIQRTRDKLLNEGKEDDAYQEPKVKRLCDELAAKSQTDMETWLAFIRQKRQDVLDSRAQRRQRRTDMAKRHTLAAQERMKIISELAADKKKEDNFGQNEDDWQVYKAINKEGGDTDSEEEQEKLQELEQILREHDPSFVKECENSNLYDFSFNLAEYYQLHIGTEQIRIPELLFQPSMMGVEQAGINETLEFILTKYSPEQQNALVQNVFLTGGCAVIPGFKTRIENNLSAIRPFQSSFKVTVANQPILDAWKGANIWANHDENLKKFSVSKQDYEEKGSEYLFEHIASNQYFPTPATQTVTKISL